MAAILSRPLCVKGAGNEEGVSMTCRHHEVIKAQFKFT